MVAAPAFAKVLSWRLRKRSTGPGSGVAHALDVRGDGLVDEATASHVTQQPRPAGCARDEPVDATVAVVVERREAHRVAAREEHPQRLVARLQDLPRRHAPREPRLLDVDHREEVHRAVLVDVVVEHPEAVVAGLRVIEHEGRGARRELVEGSVAARDEQPVRRVGRARLRDREVRAPVEVHVGDEHLLRGELARGPRQGDRRGEAASPFAAEHVHGARREHQVLAPVAVEVDEDARVPVRVGQRVGGGLEARPRAAQKEPRGLRAAEGHHVEEPVVVAVPDRRALDRRAREDVAEDGEAPHRPRLDARRARGDIVDDRRRGAGRSALARAREHAHQPAHHDALTHGLHALRSVHENVAAACAPREGRAAGNALLASERAVYRPGPMDAAENSFSNPVAASLETLS